MLGTKRKLSLLVLAVLAFVACCDRVFAAETFQFTAITSDDPSGTAGQVGSAAFILEVSDPGPGSAQALFTFNVLPGNYAYNGFFVRGVYFYDGALLSIAELIENPAEQVNFKEGAKPGHLPGITLTTHKLVTGYELLDSAGAIPSRAINGISMDESLGVLFDLQPTKTYDDVIAGIIDGTIIVGIKAQGFGPDDFSESFLTNGNYTPVPVPAPSAFLLGGLGVGVVGLLRKRKVL